MAGLIRIGSSWRQFLLVGLFTTGMCGCSQLPTAVGNQAKCLPSLTPFSFPIITPDFSTIAPNQPNPTPVPVPDGWQPQLSAGQMQKWTSRDWVKTILARNSDDIWLILNSGGLLRYRPNAQTIESYTIVGVNGVAFQPGGLLLSKTGTLWAIGYYPTNSGYLSEPHTILSRYDVQADRFVPVYDPDGVLTGLDSLGPSSPDAQTGSDAQGVLWFIVDNSLIRFDPDTRKAMRVIDKSSGYSLDFLAVAADGFVWLSAIQNQNWQGPFLVIRYDPGTGEIKEYGSPPNALGPAVLYFDRSGRLWTDDWGYLEFPATGDPVWYEIIKSPIFIYKLNDPYVYAWSGPYPFNEVAPGLFYFSSSAGIGSLDFKQGQWCLLTRSSGPFSEDDAHNLWFAVEGQIYRYHLPS
jgi:hypothetical protein